MAKYIDWEEALKILRRYGCENGSALGRHSGAVEAAEYELSMLPAADVAPVVHARWIEHRDDYENYCECSNCHNSPDSPLDTTPYCPNCGAKMDGA